MFIKKDMIIYCEYIIDKIKLIFFVFCFFLINKIKNPILFLYLFFFYELTIIFIFNFISVAAFIVYT